MAVFLCLAVSAVVGVMLFPRDISIHLASAFPVNITIPKSNKTDPFIVINVSILMCMVRVNVDLLMFLTDQR